MTLYIMRHGQTDYNREHRLQGRLDIPLSPDGIQQGEEAGTQFQQKGIRFTTVYSSPLDRALQTAELASGKSRSEIRVDPRLIEVAFGPMEGERVEELQPSMLDFFRSPETYEAPEGAETYAHLLHRTADFLDDMLQLPPEENILIVSHGAAIHSMYMNLLHLDLHDYWNLTLGNCGYFTVEPVHGELKVTGTFFQEKNRTLPFDAVPQH